jgi:hypothetical protein
MIRTNPLCGRFGVWIAGANAVAIWLNALAAIARLAVVAIAPRLGVATALVAAAL